MDRFIAAALCLLAASAAADEVQRSVDAAEDGIVVIANIAGSVEIEGWSRSEVEVVAELGRGVEELIVERDGNEVLVKVKTPRQHTRSISSDLALRVPKNSSIKVGGVSIDISVRNVLGTQRLNTVSGDIETQAFAADVDLETVSGDLEVTGDGREQRTAANTVSGDVEVDNLAGELTTTSVSGDVTVTNSRLRRAAMKTTNGDVVFRAALLDAGRLDIETINGDVDVDFDGAVSARFEIETFNGDIRNCFGPEAVRTSRYAPGRELMFTEGGGSGRVIIHTLNGDLRLCRD